MDRSAGGGVVSVSGRGGLAVLVLVGASIGGPGARSQPAGPAEGARGQPADPVDRASAGAASARGGPDDPPGAADAGETLADRPWPPPPCARAVARVASLVEQGAFVDAHLVAEIAALSCDRADLVELDAIALVRLDEGTRARARLREAVPPRPSAAVIGAWSYLVEGDRAAFDRALALLPAEAVARLRARSAIGDDDAFDATTVRLTPALRRRAAALHERRAAARRRRPWLAGVLSAVLPGAGQLYAGSPESAAVALTLSGASIAATAELAHRELYLSAALTGLAASVFYVGNILSAADLARLANGRAQAPYDEELERWLVPEVVGRPAPPR